MSFCLSGMMLYLDDGIWTVVLLSCEGVMLFCLSGMMYLDDEIWTVVLLSCDVVVLKRGFTLTKDQKAKKTKERLIVE